jgi:hypothetical protein
MGSSCLDGLEKSRERSLDAPASLPKKIDPGKVALKQTTLVGA